MLVWQGALEHVHKYVCGCTTVCDVPGKVRCKIVHAPKVHVVVFSRGKYLNETSRQSRQTPGGFKSVLIRVCIPLLLFSYSALGVSGGALFKLSAELTLSPHFASSVDT
jgi:hypothetical protein